MKLLIITGVFPLESNLLGGIFLTRNIKKLKECGVQCDVISFFIEDDWTLRLLKRIVKLPSTVFRKTLKVDDIEYRFLPLKTSLLDRLKYNMNIEKKMIHAIKNEINLKEYDLIHAHWVYPHGYAASLLKKETGIPCVITAHGSDIHTEPYASPKTIPSVIYALDHANTVIFVSRKLYETAKELGFNGNNYSIIPMGLDTSVFIPMDKVTVRKDLGLSPLYSTYVGFVGGNLISVKGADRLPELFRAIAQRHSNVQFVVIGDGELRNIIEKKSMLYHLNVIFKGRIDPNEMPQWMNAFNVLVVPSRNEGFGIVILEAQSCGCPVVGSNTGGIPEAIGTSGGIVVDTDSNFEENFAEAVSIMIDNPPEIGQLRKSVIQFDWDQIIRKQIEIYESLIQQKNPTPKNSVE